jgi:hypothetical protein
MYGIFANNLIFQLMNINYDYIDYLIDNNMNIYFVLQPSPCHEISPIVNLDVDPDNHVEEIAPVVTDLNGAKVSSVKRSLPALFTEREDCGSTSSKVTKQSDC